jgi:hypothetical protein
MKKATGLEIARGVVTLLVILTFTAIVVSGIMMWR